MALAANKNYLYEHEEVEENDGKELAKELGAIFQKTSAKEAYGVEDLFTNIGKKFINPNSTEGGSSTPASKANSNPKGQKLTSQKAKAEVGKKGCC